jgi:hypothetical protein
MASNVVAYIGYDSFDIILYLSRILQKLNRKVLIVDHSETSSLRYSIPEINGIDPKQNVVSYRQVDFTLMDVNEKLCDYYDDILIDCGYGQPKTNAQMLTRIVYVTDMYSYNSKRISNIRAYDDLNINTALLIREATDVKISTKSIAEETKKQIPPERISILYRDDRDYENSIKCHYNQNFYFLKTSTMLKAYLLNEIQVLCSHLPEKQIRMAYDKARKGV